jgi:hypothetical protein
MSGSEDFRQVSQAAEARLSAMKDADIPSLQAILHDDLVYIHSSSRVDDKENFIASVESSVLDYHSFVLSDTHLIDVSDGVVLRGGVLETSVTARGNLMQLDNRFLETWVRAGDAWQMISWQSTPRK